MIIVEWNEEVDAPKLSDEDGKKVFLAMLKRTVNEPWRGTIRRKDKAATYLKTPYAELRKELGNANVLFSIGRRQTTYDFTGKIEEEETDCPTIKMSLNGTASFTMDDFMEINLAVTEAVGVIQAMIDKDPK